MTGSNPMPTFEDLSPAQQDYFRLVNRELLSLAGKAAVPIFFGPPPRLGGIAQGASGCVVHLDSGYFVFTANHLLEKYEQRVGQGEILIWQVGYVVFDPLSRIVYRGKRGSNDLVVLEVSEDEAQRIGPPEKYHILSASAGFPPRTPLAKEPVLLAGYPEVLRETFAPGGFESGRLSAILRVRDSAPGHFWCHFEHSELISFNEQPVPPPNTEFGGISGGPVLLMRDRHYPLVGIVYECSAFMGLLYVATLDNVHL
jgi:hypothetical protein